MCVASAANAAFGADFARQAVPEETLGGPVVSAGYPASVGDGYGEVIDDAGSVLTFHDALAGDAGQSTGPLPEAGAAAFASRLSLPARGINWGILHAHNAVDVAGVCGSPIYAAAPGQIAAVREGWGGGYGNYADIDHGNGVMTRYAHAEHLSVVSGQMVAAGDVIGSMGSTGHSTGCHVHFEVLGSAAVPNPFSRR